MNMFSATDLNGWLHGTVFHPAVEHNDFWAQTFYTVL